MKKNFYLLLVFLVTLYSCQKNDIVDVYRTISVDTEYQTNKKSVNIQNVTTFHDLIKFKSVEDFENAYRTLRETQINELNGFNKKYFKYTQEQLEKLSEIELEKISFEIDNISTKVNFKEDGIYERFEKQLNFHSLRAELDKKHTQWLLNPDWNINPLDCIIPIPSLQTFYNKYNEIIIGNTFYKTNDNGVTFIIKDVTYNQILNLRKEYNKYKDYDNVKLYGVENANQSSTMSQLGTSKTNLYGCGMNKKDFKYHSFISQWTPVATYKNRFAIGIADGGIWHVTFAKNSHYKRINGVWKLTTTSWMEVEARSELYKFWSCEKDMILPNQWAYNQASAAKVVYCDEVTFGNSWQLMQSTKTHETYGRYFSHGRHFIFWLEW